MCACVCQLFLFHQTNFRSVINEWLALFMPPKVLIGAGKLAKHAPRPEYAIFAVRRTYESITTKEEGKKVNARFLMFFPFYP